jgi:glycosyltransferase involved in cell wall biosynthesis
MPSTDYPIVTIIICNYNYGEYILDAINSAVKQNYPSDRLRVVVIDDASTDNSWERVYKEYFKKIPHQNFDQMSYKVKEATLQNGVTLCAILSPKSQGPSMARNIGIGSTFESTDIYAILDADDIYYTDKVILGVQQIMMDPERIGVVYFDYDILNVETGNIVREHKKPYDKLLLHKECIVHSGAIVTKDALNTVREQNGIYDPLMRTCEDWDLWLRISERYMIIHVPESMSLVRVHKENATFSVPDAVWQQNWRRVQEKFMARQNG